MSLLSVEGLTVALPPGGDRPNAVEDITLSVNPGEIVCVVGESGSGKSITANAVMGLLPKGLRLPPRAIDDVVAQLLLERWLGKPLSRHAHLEPPLLEQERSQKRARTVKA